MHITEIWYLSAAMCLPLEASATVMYGLHPLELTMGWILSPTPFLSQVRILTMHVCCMFYPFETHVSNDWSSPELERGVNQNPVFKHFEC